jgi:hypothetical protein
MAEYANVAASCNIFRERRDRKQRSGTMKRCLNLAAMVMVLMLMFVLASWARADDAKVNPAFDAWAKFGVGSSSTYNDTIDSPQGHSTTTMTITLVDKAADHVVVETSQTSIVIGGQPRSIAPIQTTISSTFDPAKDVKQIGTEDLTVAGQTFSCKIVTPAHPKSGVMNQIKVWASDQVPGAAVKITIDMEHMKVSQVLKSFEAK